MKFSIVFTLTLMSWGALRAEQHARSEKPRPTQYSADYIRDFSKAMPNEFKRIEHENDKLYKELVGLFRPVQELPSENKEGAMDDYYKLLNKIKELANEERTAISNFKEAKESIEESTKNGLGTFETYDSANKNFNKGIAGLEKYTKQRIEMATEIQNFSKKHKLNDLQ
ncbi:MAG: hypothetical protein ACKN9V_03825 [Pseudomonadota bacterium]